MWFVTIESCGKTIVKKTIEKINCEKTIVKLNRHQNIAAHQQNIGEANPAWITNQNKSIHFISPGDLVRRGTHPSIEADVMDDSQRQVAGRCKHMCT